MKLNYGVHIKIYTYIYPIITFPSSYGKLCLRVYTLNNKKEKYEKGTKNFDKRTKKTD